jgi:hypothetical protein
VEPPHIRCDNRPFSLARQQKTTPNRDHPSSE